MSKEFSNPYTDDYGRPIATHKTHCKASDNAPNMLRSDHYYIKPMFLKSKPKDDPNVWECEIQSASGAEFDWPLLVYHDNLKQLINSLRGTTQIVCADLHEEGLSVASVWDKTSGEWVEGERC